MLIRIFNIILVFDSKPSYYGFLPQCQIFYSWLLYITRYISVIALISFSLRLKGCNTIFGAQKPYYKETINPSYNCGMCVFSLLENLQLFLAKVILQCSWLISVIGVCSVKSQRNDVILLQTFCVWLTAICSNLILCTCSLVSYLKNVG